MKKLVTRKPNRLKDYDYSQAGMYFITICIKDRMELLGKIFNQNMTLSEYGWIVKSEIENITSIRQECLIHEYVIMPNHLHLIVEIISVGYDGNRTDLHNTLRADCHLPLQDQPLQWKKSVSNMVQGLKGAVTRRIGFSLWQRSFHDHIIRNQSDYDRIAEYVKNNPMRWETDCFYVSVVGDDGNRPEINCNRSEA